MPRLAAALLVLLAPLSAAQAAAAYVEGQHYVRLTPAQHTRVPPGKIEVLEVFSYGCPACNAFQAVMARLAHALPPNAQIELLPAAFNAAEDWPMLQRAYFTAEVLGLAARTHQAMFDAVWKSGELAISDPVTHRLKSPLPSIEDAARAYARWSKVAPEAFLAAARSFAVDTKMRAADAQIHDMQVPGTPCLIVNGTWRVVMDSVSGPDELIDLVKFLVARAGAH
ncbi:MAG TPA: thiol:disulfide interchange protein DsbA/DsbL [Steroidobacteraceae bacterium]|nr:thiol:disulfide interchange protein DsbA/DsbL [Steroidobacteraceae bacterium]